MKTIDYIVWIFINAMLFGISALMVWEHYTWWQILLPLCFLVSIEEDYEEDNAK